MRPCALTPTLSRNHFQFFSKHRGRERETGTTTECVFPNVVVARGREGESFTTLQRKTLKMVSTSPSPALRGFGENRRWLRERVGVRAREQNRKKTHPTKNNNQTAPSPPCRFFLFLVWKQDHRHRLRCCLRHIHGRSGIRCSARCFSTWMC